MNGFTQKFPTLKDFRDYMATQLGEVEVIRQSLYDSVVYPTAGSTNLRFFQNPIGQGLSASQGNAGNAKTLADTNMQNAGSLPAPQGYYVQSIEVDFQPGAVATANTYTTRPPADAVAAAAATVQAGAHDVNAFYSSGALVFTIGQKPYLQEAPLLRFPPKCRFEFDVALASTSGTAVEVVKEKLKAGGRPYMIDPGLSLITSQNFDISLIWPVAVATPSGFNARVQVTIDGWLFRGVQ